MRPLRSCGLLVASVLLVACGSSSNAGPATPTVTGAAGQKPTIQIPKGTPPASLVVKVLTGGTGPAVAKGDTLVANYVGQIWATGKEFDSSWKRGQPLNIPIGVGSVIAAWDEGLVGVRAGSRVLLVVPPDKGYGVKGKPQGGISGKDTLVFVVDALASYGKTSAASGTDKPQSNPDLPAVQAARGTKPVITIPAGKNAPAALTTVVLIEGNGAVVTSGQQIAVQYVGVVWATGRQFDASWDRGEPALFAVGGGQLIKGWEETIPGVKVGSRLLITVPPDKGYGASGNAGAGIGGTDTLVFVLDVLAAF